LCVVAFDASAHRFVALQRLALPGATGGCALSRQGWRLAADARARAVAAASLDGACTLFHAAPPGADLACPLAPLPVTAQLHAPCWSLRFADVVADADASAADAPLTLLALLPGSVGAPAGPCLAVLRLDAVSGVAACATLPVHCAPGGNTAAPPHVALEVLPVPGAPGAVLLLCDGAVLLVRAAGDAAHTCAHVTYPPDALPCAWHWAPRDDAAADGHARAPVLALALDCGTLLLLRVDAAAGALTSCEVAPGGHAHAWGCLSVLAWLPHGGGLLACTHEGDGTLLRMPDDAGAASDEPLIRPAPETACVLPSTSPALDIAVHAGAPLLACGAGWAGSLRALRGGCEVRQLLLSSPDYAGVTGVWPIRAPGGGGGGAGGGAHSLLLVSFVAATRALALGAAHWRDVSDDIGIDVAARTLAAGVLDDGSGGCVLVQACPRGVRAVALRADADAGGELRGTPLQQWAPQQGEHGAVSVAAVGHGVVLLGIARSRSLLLLRLAPTGAGGPQLALVRALQLGAEPSCVCIAPAGAAHHLCSGLVAGDARAHAPVAVVGTYAPNVALLSLAPGCELAGLAGWAAAAEACVCAELSDDDARASNLVPNALHVAAYPGRDGACILVGTRAGALLRLERGGFGDGAGVPGALRCTHCRSLGRIPLGLAPLGDGAEALTGDVLALSARPLLLRLVAGLQRVSVSPLAPPAAGFAAAAAPLAPPGAPPGVLLVTGARLRLVTLCGAPHARATCAPTSLGVAPRRVTTHAPSGCVLLSYGLALGQPGAAMRHELCAVHPASGAPVSAHARLRVGECVHAMCAWPCADGDDDDASADDDLLLVGTSIGLPPGAPPEECDLGRLLIMRLDLRATRRGPAPWEDSDEEDDTGDVRMAGQHLAGSGEWVIVVRARVQLCWCT
jgi:hypothetical protein